MTKKEWRWEKGIVEESGEHIDLLYGDANEQDPAEFACIARLSPPVKMKFTVQFFPSDNEANDRSIVQEVCRELNYYLVDLREGDPWAYAKYHCTTASNWYSNVHWVCFEGRGNEGDRIA